MNLDNQAGKIYACNKFKRKNRKKIKRKSNRKWKKEQTKLFNKCLHKYTDDLNFIKEN